ncbi:MAG TPA: ExbD/TolR family protein [Elainellaceae cyanobacterium]
MRPNRPKPGSQIPEVNLVPMMDVLMTVLTFFIIISMTLSGQNIVSVDLPEAERGAGDADEEVEPFVVGLNAQGEILIAEESISLTELTGEISTYLVENPDGIVRIKADRDLRYDEVENLLRTLQDIGGNRVSLAIE